MSLAVVISMSALLGIVFWEFVIKTAYLVYGLYCELNSGTVIAIKIGDDDMKEMVGEDGNVQ